jgi:DNA-binding beta-propeller fold protein YncE
MEEGQVRYGQGFVTVLDRRSREVVGRVPTSAPNPRWIEVHGDTAYVVCAGEIEMHQGVARVKVPGAVDILELTSGVPRVVGSINLGMSAHDSRIGAPGSIAVSPDGRLAYLGSGTRGDVFAVDLERRQLLRGAADPVELFPTPAQSSGMVVARRFGAGAALLSFNGEQICLSDDWGGAVVQRRCGSLRQQKELLGGAIDVARAPDGSALVVMTLANKLLRVVDSGEALEVAETVAGTGAAANRVVVHGGAAYVVNSLSNNVQRVDLTSGRSELPFAVLPVGSNPFDLVVTEEPEGDVAWVTLLEHHQVAVIALDDGRLLATLPARSPADGGRGTDAGPDSAGDAGAGDAGVDVAREGGAADGGSRLVAVEGVVSASYGAGAGQGQGELPDVIAGGPRGGGENASSSDVLSLGAGGELVVHFGPYDIVDGPGADFIIFENPFLVGPYQPYAEPAVVGVRSDGASEFAEFPCDLSLASGDPAAQSWPYPGCAGVHPVLANVDENTIPPDEPALAGGDAFDLASLSLDRARHLRIRDAGQSQMGATTRGFDLDAVVLIHYEER